MAALTVLFTDTFIRANENPLSKGGAWGRYQEVGVNIASLQVLSNVCESTTINARNINIVTSVTFPANQWAEITVASLVGTPTVGLKLRAVSGNPGTNYAGNFSAGNTYSIQRYSGTVGTNIATAVGTLSAGDVIRFEIIGTTLNLYKNNVLQVTTTDATLASGTTGIQINPAATLTNATLSLFRAGTFGVPNSLMMMGCGT